MVQINSLPPEQKTLEAAALSLNYFKQDPTLDIPYFDFLKRIREETEDRINPQRIIKKLVSYNPEAFTTRQSIPTASYSL